MLFNSYAYFVFLPIVVLAHWVLPARLRPIWLLIVSYYFYAFWNAPFLLLIVFMTLVNFAFSSYQREKHPRSRAVLIASLSSNLIVLVIFKYLGLLEDGAARVVASLGLPLSIPLTSIVLPLGLSFFVFEFIHYQVDLYRGAPGTSSLLRFALFPAFFPTQIAGPIKRFQDFDPQVGQRRRFHATRTLAGLELIAVGLFKKVVLADNLRPAADAALSGQALPSQSDAWIGLLAFSFQIYLDFSGYTDIGRGSALLLGYFIPENFRSPYLATSPRDFWRRWHMSLSSWLRDYLYVPIGGSRMGTARTRWNLMITMGLGGLWHGAAWHFLAWGTGHGLLLVAQRAWKMRIDTRSPVSRAVAVLGAWGTTQFSVLWLWAMFRTADLGTAFHVTSAMLIGDWHLHLVTRSQVVSVIAVAFGVLGYEVLGRAHVRFLHARGLASVVLRPAEILALFLVSLYFLASSDTKQFIYFQF